MIVKYLFHNHTRITEGQRHQRCNSVPYHPFFVFVSLAGGLSAITFPSPHSSPRLSQASIYLLRSCLCCCFNASPPIHAAGNLGLPLIFSPRCCHCLHSFPVFHLLFLSSFHLYHRNVSPTQKLQTGTQLVGLQNMQ